MDYGYRLTLTYLYSEADHDQVQVAIRAERNRENGIKKLNITVYIKIRRE